MPSLIEEVASWSGGRPEFTPLVRTRARHAIADTIACMLAGANDVATGAVRATFAGGNTEGPALAVGGGRVPEAISALINGTAAHALDYDDNFRPGRTHASAVLVPALLGVALSRRATGRQLVEAYLVGLEAQAAVSRGVNPSHYTLGWHSTSTVGCIGTAAGVAWLLGLDEAGIACAMSIGVSMAAGVKGQFGTPAKPLHAGLAARNAVDAAMLAANGMTGRLDVLEAPQGFRQLYGGDDAAGWEGGAAAIGAPHSIETAGVAPKRHPCCGSAHNTVDAILDLKAAHGFNAGDVAEVHTHVGVANIRNLSFAKPENEMQARFSMHYCVAVALLKDRLELTDFTPAAVRRAEVRALLPLTTMTAYSWEEELAANARLPHRITIHLRNGSVLKGERAQAKGTIFDPFDDADRLAKFIDCSRATLEPSEAELLHSRLNQLDQAEDLTFLEAPLAEAGRKSPAKPDAAVA
ncbi:2-methylcitrate dehydratase [Agaricicola taiwanensis]|uniref:2-methylcitrate dehydratase n=1 Tax=Agaricicola taiwanensis TaxID=591372 RepID=A0A8J3DYM4_9RHOB|nr:MmgE/PrpD family protein [Agaricicola taiwanensis]GGE50146.1 2-methylcitrate dehydratase [Agaricicola taiwanensis]